MSVMDKFLLGMGDLRFNLAMSNGNITEDIKNKAEELLDILDVMDKCKILLSKILQTRVGDKVIEQYYNLPGLIHIIWYYVDEEERG